jgi:hypothetical protein
VDRPWGAAEDGQLWALVSGSHAEMGSSIVFGQCHLGRSDDAGT